MVGGCIRDIPPLAMLERWRFVVESLPAILIDHASLLFFAPAQEVFDCPFVGAVIMQALEPWIAVRLMKQCGTGVFGRPVLAFIPMLNAPGTFDAEALVV